MKKLTSLKLFLLIMISTLSFAVVTPSVVSAAPCNPGGRILGFPTWYEYLPGEYEDPNHNDAVDAGERCRPVINESADALPIGVAILEIMLRLAGIMAVIFIIYGSFQYILSQGDPDRTKNAKSTIMNSIVGLVIVLLATGIVSFIGNTIGD